MAAKFSELLKKELLKKELLKKENEFKRPLIKEEVKEEKIKKLEWLIYKIKNESLVSLLLTLLNKAETKKLNIEEIEKEIKQLYLQMSAKMDKTKDKEEIKKIQEELNMPILKKLEEEIKEQAQLMLRKNLIVFKLELCKPKLIEKTLLEIIVWIYHVEIKVEKLKTDNKKQFFYLIYNYQQAKSIKEKEEILLELLYKMQLYIKNAR